MQAFDPALATNVIPFPRQVDTTPVLGARILLGEVAKTGYLLLEGSDRDARLLAVSMATFGFLDIGAVDPDGGIVPLSAQDMIRLDARLWLLARGPLFPVMAVEA